MGRILLVDDDPGILEILDEFLGMDFETIPKQEGPKALEALSSGGISGIITDILMPKMNGIEFAQKVRESHPEMPIFAVTGAPDEILVDIKFDTNLFNQKFSKPFSGSKLVASAREHFIPKVS